MLIKPGIFYILILIVISTVLLLSLNSDVSASDSKDKTEKDSKEFLKLKVKMNINNLELKDADKIKIVAYINGEAKIRYLDIGEEKSEISNNFLISNIEFNKSNDIATVGNDEYFVCAYVVNETQIKYLKKFEGISIYDCDESMTTENTNAVTGRLFSTLSKYQKSMELNKIHLNSKQESDQVNITVITPIYDQKDVESLTVIASVKGDYQIKKVNIDDQLTKSNSKKLKDEDYIIKVPFIFNKTTELGSIQYGDMFFACATSEELGPPEKTECEKKFIKDFHKSNNIVVRHEEDFQKGGKFS